MVLARTEMHKTSFFLWWYLFSQQKATRKKLKINYHSKWVQKLFWMLSTMRNRNQTAVG